MRESAYITRKEIAILLDLTLRQVIAAEKRWGIAKLRCDVGFKPARFHRKPVIAQFAKLGLIHVESTQLSHG